jgi:hypothetical protein
MSILQNKDAVKPSKMSERYARWFGTRVPSTSALFRYFVMFLLSVPFSFIPGLTFADMTNFVIAMVFTTGLGVVIYLLYLTILQRRFQSIITDQVFSRIAESAQEKVSIQERVQIWPRQSPEPYIAATFNALFNAIIISDTMIDLIKKMPESGEAFLAFHLIKVPKERNIVDLVFPGVLFFLISSLFPLLLILSLPTSRYIFLYLLLGINALSFLTVMMAIAVRGAFWVHDSAFERISGLYGIHPQVAKDEVMSSHPLDDEATRAIIWVVRDWESTKRNGRRGSIAILVLVVSFIVYYIMMASNPLIFYYPSILNIPILMASISLAIAFIIYMLLRRWDKKCMGELFFETTRADEPIWID